MNEFVVRDAVERGGGQRGAARLLGKPLSSIQYWLKQNNFRVVKTVTITATIEKITDKTA